MKRPKEKRERALGEHLHLKGDRCDSPKCALVRRPYKPGVHGPQARRKNPSDFGRQIAEKQKFKLTYGVDERTLSRLFERAKKSQAETSIKLISFLESRLDNAVYRAGFAKSRTIGRQLITHGHVLVNGKKVRSPGYEVSPGDAITLRPESRPKNLFSGLKERLKEYDAPSWIALDADKEEAKIISMPEENQLPFEINLLVESFSK
jgi:small subunit ribosomal protein S4